MNNNCTAASNARCVRQQSWMSTHPYFGMNFVLRYQVTASNVVAPQSGTNNRPVTGTTGNQKLSGQSVIMHAPCQTKPSQPPVLYLPRQATLVEHTLIDDMILPGYAIHVVQRSHMQGPKTGQ